MSKLYQMICQIIMVKFCLHIFFHCHDVFLGVPKTPKVAGRCFDFVGHFAGGTVN